MISGSQAWGRETALKTVISTNNALLGRLIKKDLVCLIIKDLVSFLTRTIGHDQFNNINFGLCLSLQIYSGRRIIEKNCKTSL